MNDQLRELLTSLSESRYYAQILLTIIFIFGSFLIRKILHFRIEKRDDLKKKEKFNLRNKTSHFSNIITVLVVSVLWFSIIQSALISFFAVAAAFVIATKELIMCFTGGILVVINKHFRVGDRIDIDGLRGYVVYKSMTATKILEIGPEKLSQQTTGHVITVPNSVFLTKSIKNESYFKGYSISSFIFKVDDKQECEKLEAFLLEKAVEICSSYLKQAKKQITHYCDKEGLDIPAIEPKVKLSLNDKNELFIILKMPVKNYEVATVEQTLIRSFIKRASFTEESAI